VFTIRLSNGFIWKARGTAETAGWLRNMAGFLGVSGENAGSCADFRVERAEFRAGRRYDARAALDLSSHGVVCPAGWCIRAWPDLALLNHEELSYVLAGIADAADREARIEQMRRAMLPFYEAVSAKGGLPLHTALAEIRGYGVLLAGVSGAGKSTCCRRFPAPWRALGDDMAVAVPCGDGVFRAHPLPTWSALKARTLERPCVLPHSVPVRAVFFLARGDADEVAPVSGARAALSIYDAAMQVFSSVDHSAYTPGGSTYRRIVFENAAAMAAAVPAFVLHVSLHGRFWEKIEEALEKGDSPHFRRAHGA